MPITRIDGETYSRMVRLGASRLYDNKKTVNDLNVFPIPDGDTGDNMYMTILAGCNEAADKAGENLTTVASAVSNGMLLGARGNSGVILSRIYAGMAKGLEGLAEAGIEQFAKAMSAGVEEAYGSVPEPVEGTILTVLRDGVDQAWRKGPQSFEAYFEALCDAFEESLEHTPELLAVLAEAGVVDSGGAGLVYIGQGMRDALGGEDAQPGGPVPQQTSHIDLSSFGPDSVLEFGYCTEFLLRLQSCKVDLDSFDDSVIRDYLASAGESLVYFRDGSIVKVHVHTHTPGEILNSCQQWGEFLTLKIENMTLQHHENRMAEKHPSKGPAKKSAVVTVASGDGLVRMFEDMGADVVIAGGQTMNPSAEDFLNAFESLNAKTIYVLPNNSNIIMTAQQAASICKDSKVVVLPTKSIGDGYAVLGSVDFSMDPDAIVSAAAAATEAVVTAMVSRSIRDTKDSVEGHFIGFVKDDILSDDPDRNAAAEKLLDAAGADGYDVILVLKGRDVDADEAASLLDSLEKKYPCSEVVLNDAGQPVFDYIIILE